MSSSPTFLDPIVVPLIRGRTILDVGCGYGRWGCLLRTNYWESGLSEPPIVDALDAFAPNVDYCKSLGVYNRVWEQCLPGTVDGSWDTVLASEILEHLDQDQVPSTLETLENAARRRIIITAPNWHDVRPGSATFLGYNEFEAHKSHISRRYLKDRGYKLLGGGFGNPGKLAIRAMMKLSPLRIPRFLASITAEIPAWGHTLVAYKDVR